MDRALGTGLAFCCVLWLALFVLMPASVFTVDETVLVMALDALAERGSLVVETGYSFLGEPALRLAFLREGRLGLVPQYPPGPTLLTLPLVEAAGLKGAMVLNMAAGLALLAVTAALGRRLFAPSWIGLAGATILLGATFLVEYGPAIWPHALAAAASTAAALTAVLAVQTSRPGGGALAWAALSGLLIGFGLLIRVDVVLALPPVAVWLALAAPAPLRLLFALGFGLLPGLALASWINWLKFGVGLPISYGESGGDADLLNYLPLGALMAAGFAGLLALRLLPALRPSRRIGLGAGAVALLIAAAAVVVSQEAQSLGARAAKGLWVLLVDLSVTDRVAFEPGLATGPSGEVMFFGHVKKALGQSLPWIGALLALAVLPTRKENRPGLWLALLMIGGTLAPFVLRQWHGGYGHNLRYLLPALPWLALLCALVLERLAARSGPLPPRGVMLALTAGALLVAAPMLLLPDRADLLIGYRLPPWLLGLGVGLALAAGLRGGAGRGAAQAAQVVAFAGLGFAAASAWGHDVARTVHQRALTETVTRLYDDALPGPALAISTPIWWAHTGLLTQSDVVLAPWHPTSAAFGPDLVHRAIDAGLTVVSFQPHATETLVSADPSLAARPLDWAGPEAERLVRLPSE